MIVYPTRLDMIRSLPANSVGVEIGVQRGDFSEQILSTPVSMLHLVDAWDANRGDPKDPAHIDQGGQEENFRHVLKRFSTYPRVIIHRTCSLYAAINAAENHDKLVDWVYIDADHRLTAVFTDLVAWSRALKPDGVIMGHDYVDNEQSRKMGFGVVPAVSSFCNQFNWELCAITEEEWPSFQLKRVS